MNGFVRTVLGDVPPGELGSTYCHEHLITRPAPRFGDDLRLDDEDKAAEELARFRVAGGGALVDATTPEFGCDAAALRRLAERTSVHVVATTPGARRGRRVREGDKKASPCVSTSTPPWAPYASRRTRRCSAKASA